MRGLTDEEENSRGQCEEDHQDVLSLLEGDEECGSNIDIMTERFLDSGVDDVSETPRRRRSFHDVVLLLPERSEGVPGFSGPDSNADCDKSVLVVEAKIRCARTLNKDDDRQIADEERIDEARADDVFRARLSRTAEIRS